MVPGYVVIIAIVVLAVGASSFSWFYYRRLQERPLALWGSRAAELMLRAPVARLYRLSPVENEEATGEIAPPDAAKGRAANNATVTRVFTIGGERYAALDERDISRAPGFSHIRQGLIHDRSFAWDELADAAPRQWEYAIEFEGPGSAAVVAFDFRAARATLVGGERSVSIRPVGAAIQVFLREQFPETGPAPAAR